MAFQMMRRSPPMMSNAFFVHGFIFDVKMFRFDACFFEAVESADEALIVGGVRGERKVLVASNGFLMAVPVLVGVSN